MKIYYLVLAFCGTCSMFVNAEKLMINTEEYAPLSFTDKDGKVKGIATEQVELILKRASIDYELKVYPWARAYKNAETTKNHCVFTTSNTPAREKLFKWVEPLSLNKSILVKLKGSDINVASLDDAKKYKIGIQNQDVGGEYLKKSGFPKLSAAGDADKSLKKLKSNRVDMVAMAESRYKALVDSGEPLEKVTDIFALKMGLACNQAVSDDTISALQKELDKLIADGTQEKIAKSYQ
ncbi:substrate-binding periplasmic protein [Spartinivicinus poritis]|uniref:Transporter substrate-binding domain-containing protein n=1 Tax=Spartinivicinus poritis TaxID=2994640 RepID=A0ABT5UDZ5_9GAMM|nr:transporter substrate-binding domain-containing protein [Spartinivicinus sp. A2-2]MDE1464537.1 transporter substrate-binding domain-containing protein [Spartinivicinus sp. A2-2]